MMNKRAGHEAPLCINQVRAGEMAKKKDSQEEFKQADLLSQDQAENGSAEPVQAAKPQKAKKYYEVTVHRRNPEDSPFVDVNVNNNGVTRIRVGQKVTVSEPVFNVLQNAKVESYKFFLDGSSREAYEKQVTPKYPMTVHQVLED